MFYDDLIEELNHIAATSNSIPAQMCGEAAETIKSILDKDELAKENIRLREEIKALKDAPPIQIQATTGTVGPEIFYGIYGGVGGGITVIPSASSAAAIQSNANQQSEYLRQLERDRLLKEKQQMLGQWSSGISQYHK